MSERRRKRPHCEATSARIEVADGIIRSLERIGKVEVGLTRAKSELASVRRLASDGRCTEAQAALDSAEARLRNAAGLTSFVRRSWRSTWR